MVGGVCLVANGLVAGHAEVEVGCRAVQTADDMAQDAGLNVEEVIAAVADAACSQVFALEVLWVKVQFGAERTREKVVGSVVELEAGELRTVEGEGALGAIVAAGRAGRVGVKVRRHAYTHHRRARSRDRSHTQYKTTGWLISSGSSCRGHRSRSESLEPQNRLTRY